MVRVALIGPPGAGKGTQARRMAARFRIPHISTGDVLRDQVARRTDLGIRAAHVVQTGGMLDDDLILSLLDERLSLGDCSRGFILDGVPRTRTQAVGMCGSTHGERRTVGLVIALEVSEDAVAARVASRLFDPISFATYDERWSPAPVDIAHRLIRRPDDGSEAHKRRMLEFKQHFDEVCEYCAELGILRSVNADAHPESVTERLIAAIEASMDGSQ